MFASVLKCHQMLIFPAGAKYICYSTNLDIHCQWYSSRCKWYISSHYQWCSHCHCQEPLPVGHQPLPVPQQPLSVLQQQTLSVVGLYNSNRSSSSMQSLSSPPHPTPFFFKLDQLKTTKQPYRGTATHTNKRSDTK